MKLGCYMHNQHTQNSAFPLFIEQSGTLCRLPCFWLVGEGWGNLPSEQPTASQP